MSYKLVQLVMDADNDLIGVPRFVMVILAEYVNHKNGDQHCWPALGAIAQRAGLSTRQAQRILRDLESQGYLRIELGTGRNHTNRYYIQPIALERVTPTSPIDETERVTSRAQRVTPSALKGDTAMSPEPVEPEIEPEEDAPIKQEYVYKNGFPTPLHNINNYH